MPFKCFFLKYSVINIYINEESDKWSRTFPHANIAILLTIMRPFQFYSNLFYVRVVICSTKLIR